MKNLRSIARVTTLLLVIMSACKKDDIKPREVILYETDFSRNNDTAQWKTGAMGTGLSGTLQGGYYEFRNASAKHYIVGPLNLFDGLSGSNMAVEASVKISYVLSTQPSEAWGGLVWNNNLDNNTAFYFEITTAGGYVIWGHPDASGDYVLYKDHTKSTTIRPGQFNVLRIELRNRQLHFFINGTEVYSMEVVNENTLKHAGLGAYPQSNLQADYFKTVQLP
ncbi:hypothetical protein [Chitinophaga sp.]|uniref:hypothetical protein n=1 Tax=Chitinophaga sp. TaxID=1869181 RepID=UPI002F921C27